MKDKPKVKDDYKLIPFAKALLTQFRVEQGKRGRHGCICNECEVDMIKAFRRLMNDIEK